MRHFKEPKKWYVAYHIVDARRGLISPRNGYELPWRVGETRCYTGEIVLCASGYHSSPSIQDAWFHGRSYGYAICKVLISRPVKTESIPEKKSVSRWRKLVCYVNIMRVLGYTRYKKAYSNRQLSAADLKSLKNALAKAEAKVLARAKAKK